MLMQYECDMYYAYMHTCCVEYNVLLYKMRHFDLTTCIINMCMKCGAF